MQGHLCSYFGACKLLFDWIQMSGWSLSRLFDETPYHCLSNWLLMRDCTSPMALIRISVLASILIHTNIFTCIVSNSFPENFPLVVFSPTFGSNSHFFECGFYFVDGHCVHITLINWWFIIFCWGNTQSWSLSSLFEDVCFPVLIIFFSILVWLPFKTLKVVNSFQS